MKEDKIKKRASSADVARLAGVSRATVSAYINGTRYVSQELGSKIEEAIKTLHYRPDPLARALKMEDTKTIGLIIPVLSRFFTPIMQAINDQAQQAGYGFLLSSSEEDPEREREALEVFHGKRISGILIVPAAEENIDIITELNTMNTPVVQVNRRIDGLNVDSVLSDNFGAAYRAARHLIDRGRRRIAFLGYDPHTLSGQEKKAGYEKALEEAGLPGGLVIQVKDHDPDDIREKFSAFLDSGKEIDGIICSTQGKTAAGVAVLKDRGIRIPSDVSVIGFDDTPWSSLMDPPLTVVSEDSYRMGEEAAKLLMDRMERRYEGDARRIVLKDTLIERESV